jgi:hypothetical protein
MATAAAVERMSAILFNLFNRIRGSGREVFVSLNEHGVELASTVGASIATWPYEAIRIVPNDAIGEPVTLRLPHDDIHELRIADLAWVSAITERSPDLQSAWRAARWAKIGLIWSGVPDQAQAAIILGSLALVIWGGHSVLSWLADLW